MQIAKNTVVSIHYTLKDNSGKVIDTSDGGAPLTYIQGIGNLIPGMEVTAGMQFQAQGDHGAQIVTVTEVGLESVTVDGNHPLAGVELNFDVEVMSVRAATKDELDHGHVHGEGGHHH